MKKKKIRIHPIIKDLQKIEQKAMQGKYWFAIRPIKEAINKVGHIISSINEGDCKGWS